MNKQEMLDQLEIARRTKDKNLFLGLIKDESRYTRDDLDEIIEVTEKILDVLEEWEWLEFMIDYTGKLVRENPADSQCKQEMGCYFYRLGYIEKAEAYFLSSLELFENPLARHYLNELRKKRSCKEGRGEI